MGQIIQKGNSYASGDQVTASNLNALVDSASFVSGSGNTTDDATIEVHTNGYLKIKDGGVGTAQVEDGSITQAKLDSGIELGGGSTTPAEDSVGENAIANGAVTMDKIANGAVVTTKLFDGAVTSVKLHSSLRDKVGYDDSDTIPVYTIRRLTQSQYDALSPDTNTLYIIEG